MVLITDKIEQYTRDFHAFETTLPNDEPAWLHQIRKKAIARFDELGFPTTRNEDWRQTNVSPIVKTTYERSTPGTAYSGEGLDAFTFGGVSQSQLVFVNGFYSESLSSVAGLPEGVRIKNLALAISDSPANLEPYLSRMGSYDHNAFAALNTAFLQDGAYIHVPEGVVVEEPIHFLFVQTVADRPYVTYPRNLFVVGNNAQVTLIESYAGIGDQAYLTNNVTEFVVGENAVVDHYKIQRESLAAHHISNTQIYLERSSTFTTNNIVFGGAITRNDIDAKLDAENIECTMNGLYMVDGDQHVDNHTLLIHEKPNCNSHELYKGILSGRSSGVFRGKIFVQKDAQKTDAIQNSKSLLLSDDAQVQAMPQLEIYADDVKCTHGATTGHLEEDAIFYLQSRGVNKAAARGLLTYAFASELISRMKSQAVKNKLDEILHVRLPIDE